ncbi:HAMP domain-containing histidine kinase [Pusillimonas sp. MFBS29]|uniref:sensor histidine kinase n=1 Tax=Pusillimonas sp. MFBS29 TaxID=2886690 RepID=UPI001D0F9E1B|nr:HAMP domain-containing sensor histidine kinase [Pusillimonas sp. MFBS29]MCC2596910.1 HAMP domain-containing histidine kinase [Pusillimonas sp. MFBS29]
MQNSFSDQKRPSRHSLVLRVTYALTALVWVSVVAVCFLAYEAQKSMGERVIAHLVQTEAMRLQAKKSLESDSWTPAFERQLGPNMHAWGESDAHPAANMPAILRTQPLGLSRVRIEDKTWQVMAVEARDGRLYVAYDIHSAQAFSGRFGWVLLGIALFFMVLSYLLARLLAKWAVQPIQALTAHLARWAPGRPRMFGLASNEGAQLTEAFNRMQDRIDQALADQKEFSSNFNHEVRTPLALIRTDAELGGLEAGCPDKVALRFERIMRSADEMTQSLEATYCLAQAEHGQVEPISIKECVDDVFARAEPEARSRGLALRNQVAGEHIEHVNRHMLLTVIRNIVRNAVAHAAPATLEIASAGHGLRFSDDGPGINLEGVPCLFDRYYSTRRVDARSGPGTMLHPGDEVGLGLAIAKRVCVVQGWDLEVVEPTGPGKGLTLTLSFRPVA